MANEVVSIEERIKQQLALQQQQTSALRSGGNFISFKNGNLKVNDTPVPNNTIDVRVLAIVPERAWYDGPYDADSPQAPACYALGTTGVPHPLAENPQCSTCKECPKNQWGSAPPRPGSTTPGKGKACKEGARVIVVPAGSDLSVAGLYQAKIPVSSLKNLEGFVLRANPQTSLLGEYITALSVAEDKKTFFKVHFNIREHTKSMPMELLIRRQEEAVELAMQPHPSFED